MKFRQDNQHRQHGAPWQPSHIALAVGLVGTLTMGVAAAAAVHYADSSHGSGALDPVLAGTRPTAVHSSAGAGTTTGPPGASASVPSLPPVPTGPTDDVVPAGVALRPVDGGVQYFSQWPNGFRGSNTFIPIGVFPSQAPPPQLAAEGINFFTPMRNEAAGTWCPVWSNPNGNDMTGVDAQPGFYAGGTFYDTAGGRSWGSRAAFEVFGDELDGTSKGFFDCLPSSITSHNQAGSGGGLSAAAFLAAESASRAADPSRPTYIQVTTSFIDGGSDYFYTLAQKQQICAGAGILSFDVYPLVLRGSNVWDMYDQVEEARRYCQDSRPVMAFTEMDHMDQGSIYPQPAQTTAEVWNAVIAGARGVEYFDQYSDINDQSYTGNGHYPAGAMYNAVKDTDARIIALAPVINAPFADGYVSVGASMSVMAKYFDGHFYIFAIPHAHGSRTAEFTLTGGGSATVTVLDENRTLKVSDGHFSDSFANEDTVHIYEINTG